MTGGQLVAFSRGWGVTGGQLVAFSRGWGVTGGQLVTFSCGWGVSDGDIVVVSFGRGVTGVEVVAFIDGWGVTVGHLVLVSLHRGEFAKIHFGQGQSLVSLTGKSTQLKDLSGRFPPEFIHVLIGSRAPKCSGCLEGVPARYWCVRLSTNLSFH